MNQQFFNNLIIPFCTNYYYVNSILFKKHLDYNALCKTELKNDQNYYPIKDYDTLAFNNFNKSTANSAIYENSKDTLNKFFKVDPQNGFPLRVLDTLMKNTETFEGSTLLSLAKFNCPNFRWNLYDWTGIVIQIWHNEKVVFWKCVSIENKVGNYIYRKPHKNLSLQTLKWNSWEQFPVEVVLPNKIEKEARLQVFIWNNNKNQLWIDDWLIGLRPNFKPIKLEGRE